MLFDNNNTFDIYISLQILSFIGFTKLDFVSTPYCPRINDWFLALLFYSEIFLPKLQAELKIIYLCGVLW